MNVPFSIQPLVAVCALGVLVWDRSRIRSRLSRLSQHQSNMDSTLNQFMQEWERTLREFSRLYFSGNVTGFPPRSNREPLPDLSCRTTPSGGRVSSSRLVEKRFELASPGEGVARKKQVLELARKGASVQEIANRFRMPQGEVGLILNLGQDLGTTGETS
jgi:hypothetical protein